MPTQNENLNILVVEDNPADFYLFEHLLLNSHLSIGKIYSANRLQEARNFLYEETVNIVLLDLSLPDSFGIDSLKELKDLTHHIPVIIITGLSDTETALEALKQNAQDYLVKGEIDSNLLSKSIEYSLERKKIEEKILASEEKYKQIFYKNPFPMWIYDEKSLRILEVNDAAINKYGYPRKEFLDLYLADIHLEALSNNDPNEERWKHKKKNGQSIIVQFTYYPINYNGRTAMQVQVNDITENIRLEKELNLKKQQLVEAVLNAQEIERRKIGGELHDNINQVLTAVKLNLDIAHENQENSNALVSKSIQNISFVIEEIRKLSKELILPGNLKELGLIESVEELMKETLSIKNIKFEFIANVNESYLTQDHKLTIYRIIQEQLNNILKHSKASFVTIKMEVSSVSIQLSISDNGIGFNPAIHRNGVGLTNILSRAELFNGNANIITSPGKGCKLEICLYGKKDLVKKYSSSQNFQLSPYN